MVSPPYNSAPPRPPPAKPPLRRWNNFDFFVVVLCLPMWGDSLGGGSVALLRLMRLARLAKLVKKIPQLQTIMMGLLGGFESIG